MSELDRLYKLMDDGFNGVHSRLDALNGRTRENEQDIAVLKDRGGSAARWGAGASAALVALVEIVRQVWGGGK